MQMTTSAPSARPLHLLIVSSTDTSTHIHGADRDWVNLLNALGPERVRVTWAGIRDSKLLARYLHNSLAVRYLDLDFVPFYELVYESMYRARSTRNWAGIIRANLRGARRTGKVLSQALRDDKPDVVITNTSVVLPGAAYARAERLPHVWCVKEFLDPQVSACRKYAWLIEKLSDAVVIPSAAIGKAFTRARVLCDGSDLELIERSVADVDRAKVLQSLDLPPAQLAIAQTGVISQAKGQQLTAQACARLAQAGTRPCSLLFLGAGKEEDKEALRSALPDDWRQSMRFIEFEPGDFSYLAAADIIVHPSTIPDPYPNAVREAMILGKPVIGSRSGGIPELVIDKVTGILVEPNDEPALAQALGRLIDSPETRAQMGAAGRQRASEKFDAKVCKNAFHDLLLELTSPA